MKCYKTGKSGQTCTEDTIREEWEIAVSEADYTGTFEEYLEEVSTCGGYYTPIEADYRDIDDDTYHTTAELRAEYEGFKAAGYTEAADFDEYLENCLAINNGTLERIEK